jgi:riboflavin synthase
MFTGIITAVGAIVAVQPLGAGAASGVHLVIETPAGYLDDVVPGDSIALNGACMTATRVDVTGVRFEVDVSAESLARTSGLDRLGRVNLELALRLGDRLGGHMVSGHVDGIGEVLALQPTGESTELRLRCPRELARFIAVKGSLVVHGVSLTVNRVSDEPGGCLISINLIPHTMAHTTFGDLRAGSRVNLEIDLVARYVERLSSAPPA